MKRWLLMVAIFSLPGINKASSQQLYTSQQIIHAADSCLRSYVGDSLYRHFKREALMEYSIYDSLAGSWGGYLRDTSNAIYGALMYVSVDYYYYFDYPKCPQLPPFTGRAHISLDSNLYQTNRLWFAFLPDRIVKNLPCDFISEAEAIRIAEKDGLVAGASPIITDLFYYSEVKDYVWRVFASCTDENGQMGNDLVMIDATTGKIIIHGKLFSPPPLMEDYGG
jgi:hypothetical protein